MKAADFSKMPVDHLAFDMAANPIDLHPLQHRENHVVFRRLFLSFCRLSLIQQFLNLVQCKELVVGTVHETAPRDALCNVSPKIRTLMSPVQLCVRAENEKLIQKQKLFCCLCHLRV